MARIDAYLAKSSDLPAGWDAVIENAEAINIALAKDKIPLDVQRQLRAGIMRALELKGHGGTARAHGTSSKIRHAVGDTMARVGQHDVFMQTTGSGVHITKIVAAGNRAVRRSSR
ncbi:MAG: hypothetical protein HY817_05600 [Candidatus Abawacabacteria bacterium]|nr:hypothetical protein [Candidatus Abawacabacteria bacterium]